jgi:hypothetical protein
MNMKNAYASQESPQAKQEARDLAQLAAQIQAWAGPDKTSKAEALAAAWKYFDDAMVFMANLPVLTSVAPASLGVPGADATVAFTGTGFNESTVVNWNGGDEPTEFISKTEVRTVVKPSTVEAPLPFTLPVYVHNGGVASNVLEFTFTAAEGRRR